MTAPQTPDEQPAHPLGPPDGTGKRTGREAAAGALIALLCAVAGVLLGFLWLRLAPRVPLVSDGSAIYLKDSEGEQSIGADGWFTLLGLGMGLVSALLVFWRRRQGVAVVLGLAVGGVLGSVLAWQLGVHLGPSKDLIAHAKQIGANKVFHGPLALHAKGALLAWPLAAVVGYVALVAVLTSEPPPAPWPVWGAAQGWTGPSGSGDHFVSYTPADPGAAPAAGQAPPTGDAPGGQDTAAPGEGPREDRREG